MRLPLSLACCLSLAACSESVDLTVYQKSLSSWNPIDVTSSERTLSVILNEDRVTDSMYSIIIKAGICGPFWLGEEQHQLSSFDSVSVSNRAGSQGYVFESPLEGCSELGDVSDKDFNVSLMGRTHLL